MQDLLLALVVFWDLVEEVLGFTEVPETQDYDEGGNDDDIDGLDEEGRHGDCGVVVDYESWTDYHADRGEDTHSSHNV